MRPFPLAPLFLIATTVLATTVLGACASAPTAPRGTDSEKPARIIDAHVHAEFSGEQERTSGIPVTENRFFEEWREAGVVGAVSHAPRGKRPSALGLRKKGVIFCAGAAEKPDLIEIEAGLREKLYSCIKIYLGYVHQWASAPAYQPLYRLARKYRVPVVFHTGDTYSTRGKLKYADPLTVDEVAVDYPDVTFVIAHLGNPWIESAAEVAYKNPNVFLELSALLIADLDTQDRAKVDELVVKPIAWALTYVEDPGKLLFGTDWPLTRIASYVKAVQRAIPREHWSAVFHDNALRVFPALQESHSWIKAPAKPTP
jgi:hypothetical protein